MSSERIFDKLGSEISLEAGRSLLRDHLIKQVERQNQHPEESEALAYELAGLLSTDFARSLSDDDPLKKVLDLAGNLELPEKHRGGATWEELASLVEQLP